MLNVNGMIGCVDAQEHTLEAVVANHTQPETDACVVKIEANVVFLFSTPKSVEFSKIDFKVCWFGFLFCEQKFFVTVR